MGFTRIILPRANLKQIKVPEGAELIGVSSVAEAVMLLKRNKQDG